MQEILGQQLVLRGRFGYSTMVTSKELRVGRSNVRTTHLLLVVDSEELGLKMCYCSTPSPFLSQEEWTGPLGSLA